MKQPSLRHRRALRTFIVAVIMILANATAAWAQSAFSGGDGTSGNPFQIASVADLRQLATDVNSGTTYSGKYFKLINDIDFYQATDTSLRPTAAWNVESTQNNFTPIGNNIHSFQGYFNGDDHTIRGIRIYGNDDNASSNYKALFGLINLSAKVEKVKLDDARITGHLYCSGIVACNSNGSIVTACTVTDRVAIHAKTNSSHYHGGIVGSNAETCSVTDCTSSATLTIAEGVTSCMFYGGVVGYLLYNSTYNKPTITGNVAIGATVPKAAYNYYGAICGYVKLNQCKLEGNYYASCTVADEENATNVGIYDASVKDVDGACRIYKLTLGEGITATGTEIATYRNVKYYLQGTAITLNGKQTGTLAEGFSYSDYYTVNGSDIYYETFEMPAQDTEVTSTIKPVYKLVLANGITADGAIATTYGGYNYYFEGTAITLRGKQTDTPPEGFIYSNDYTVNGSTIYYETFYMPAQDTEVTSATKPVYKLTLADGITADGAIATTYGGYNYYLEWTAITLRGKQTGTLPEGSVYGDGYIVNGKAIYSSTFYMPAQDTEVTSTIIPVYSLSLADGISASPDPATIIDGIGYYIAGTTITLSGPDAGEGFVYTYILNGTDIDGARFEMPATNSTVALGEKTDDWMYVYAGTSTDPYQIKTNSDLDKLATRVNSGTKFSGKYFKLMNDISYAHNLDRNDATSTESNYTPIGKWVDNSTRKPFSGTFDGGGHTVSGIRIYKDGDAWDDCILGLFGHVSGGVVKNVTVADTRITGFRFCGGIVGYIDYDYDSGTKIRGTVENCHVLSDVAIHAVTNDAEKHGGIAGEANDATISGCTSAVTLSVATELTGCVYFGGIVGEPYDVSMRHCFAVGVSIPVAVGDSFAGSGAITGLSTYNSLDHNYYIDCNVGGKTTDIGGPSGDINDTEDPDGAMPAIALYDNGTTNATTIVNYNEQTQNVALYGRTLYKDGDWNTLCLPFPIANIETEGCPLKGATVRELDKAFITGTTLTLNFKNATTAIEAGKPYIVKWESTGTTEDTELKSPVFSGVTVSDATNDYDTQTASPAVTTDERVRFIGTYEQKTIAGEDKSILFLGAENTLYYPSGQNDGVAIGACRAYFKIGDDAAQARQLTDFNLNFSEATGITTTNYTNFTNSDNSWYSLDGRKLATKPTAKGLYIHGGVKVVIK